MNKFQKLTRVLTGIIMFIAGILLCIFQDRGFVLILAILGISLVVRGASLLIYYFRMARYMVGGKYLLYFGIIIMDFGAFTLTITHVEKIYIALYLLGAYAFSGVIDILRSFEAKSYGGAWKGKLANGILNLLTAAACLIFIQYDTIPIYIYTGGLIYSAVVRIHSAFKPSAVVYIQ